MNDKSYNGYPNYETWVTALWIDNEEGSYRYWHEQATECYEDAEDHEHYLTRAEQARYQLAGRLKEDFDMGTPEECTGVYADLLGAALSEVHWDEIARHLIESVVEETTASE